MCIRDRNGGLGPGNGGRGGPGGNGGLGPGPGNGGRGGNGGKKNHQNQGGTIIPCLSIEFIG